MEKTLEKKYGLITAICVVVGTVIGSGVFFKAQNILQKTEGNMPLGILAWVIGGLIMISCITAFAVMATKYEKVNGAVDYAEATVGGKYGYYMGWFMALIYYPAMTSVLAWVTARYTMVFVATAFPDIPLTVPVEQGGCVVGPETMALALFFMCFAYAVNTLGPKLAGYLQVSTTFIKLIPLGLMMVVGIIAGLVGENGMLVENMAYTGTSDASTSSLLFGAVVATSFAYEGWIIATSINAELKDAKKNLPIALLVGGVIIMAVYTFYYIGVAGVASLDQLINEGATVAYLNLFGSKFGNILNAFVAISCLGTLNGLMLACTRGLYALAARDQGPNPEMYKQIDANTNMPNNASVFGLMLCGIWFLFFYGGNLAPNNWFGLFAFDSSELPIVTIYAMYIPIFIMFMKKATDLSPFKRFVLPTLGTIGSAFMVIAAIYAHGITPYMAAKEAGGFSCPVLFYLVVFVVVLAAGAYFLKKNEK